MNNGISLTEKQEEIFLDPNFNEQEWREECNPSSSDILALQKLKREDY